MNREQANNPSDSTSERRKAVVYLGIKTYNDAIDYALQNGLIVPNYDEMCAIHSHFPQNAYYQNYRAYLTSTTATFETNEFVVCPPQKTRLKTDHCPFLGIEKGLTLTDIEKGNFILFHSLEDYKKHVQQSTSETPISEMREYDERLLAEWFDYYYYMNPFPANVQEHKRIFLKNRYPNKELEDLIKQREELDKRINELNNVNKNKKKY